jgi:hypothetical protein
MRLGSGSGIVGIGAALRMTTGIVESGRTEALGSGATSGIGAELGSGSAVGTDTAVGRGGITDGNGMRLGSGAASVGTATGGNGPSDGVAAVGVTGAALHATDASSANKTSGRMTNLPTSERSKSFATERPTQRKQQVVAVQGARGRLTGPEPAP